MKITLKHSNAIRLSVMTLLMVGIVGCSSSGPRNTGQKLSDRQVARTVKKNLSEDPTFKYDDVQANVYDGNVQLTGFVDTSEQRLRAAEIASRAKGAKQVINEIMIKPTPTGPVSIRDPLGHETGKILVDTNSAPPHLRNLPSSNTPVQPNEPAEGTTPK
jgi:hypothetical protein